jgi:hypothetical protein
MPIGYLLPSHVHVYSSVDNGATLTELTRPAQWDFNQAATSVVLKTGIASGTAIVLRRITPQAGSYAEFGQGTLLTAEQLNDATTFTLYLTQESDDEVTASVADSSVALAQSNEALTKANQAIAESGPALDQSTTALSNSTTALSNSSTALSQSTTALSTANTANANASAAVVTANSADTKADAAIAAVANSVNYTAIANVAGIPATPANNTYIEIADSTGLQSFTPLAGMPAGFIGDPGLSVRLRYTSSPATWNWINYYASGPDGRYLKQIGGTLTGPLVLAGPPTAPLNPATKAYTDAADATLTTAASNAQSTANTANTTANTANTTANAAQTAANAALPKAGGTMTGNLVFAAGQPTATTAAAGIVQLTDATNSTSTTTAATPASVKAVQDFAQVVSGTAAAAMPKTGGTFTGNITVPSINGGPLAGFRNAIINGNFDIWQRGTSFASPASLSYTADRWRIGFSGTGATRTISRQAFTLGQTDVPSEPTYFLRFNQSVAGSGGALNELTQKIEGARTFAGQQVTVSFYAKAASSLTLDLALVQSFGTGGSPSTAVTLSLATGVSVTTAWQKFSYSTTVASVSGKILGSDGNDFFDLVIRLPVNTTFTFDIAQVQVEPGPVATPFERRPIGTELALCQRYYELYTPAQDTFATALATTGLFRVSGVWKQEKRAVPTITSTVSASHVAAGPLGTSGWSCVLTAGSTSNVRVISVDAEL